MSCLDNTLFLASEHAFITEMLLKQWQQYLELEVEDSLVGFLEVHLARNAEGITATLANGGLAQRIIDAQQIENSHQKTHQFSRSLR